jgi:hypothetical protein
MRDLDGRLAGWGLPRDHFETDISSFLEPQPEEVPEVKYPQSYQAMFGGTPGTVHMNGDGVEFVYFNHGSKPFERVNISPAYAHMVIPTKRKAPVLPHKPIPIQPQKSASHPVLGMPVQTAPLQQSTSMQPVLTPTNTVSHTRSLPQQPINQGVTRQLAIPHVDPAQVLQILLNQLAISSQLNSHQSADRTSSTCDRTVKHSRFCWSKNINGTKTTSKSPRRSTSKDSIS